MVWSAPVCILDTLGERAKKVAFPAHVANLFTNFRKTIDSRENRRLEFRVHDLLLDRALSGVWAAVPRPLDYF